MHLVLAVHRDFHPLTEGVHHRDADTVETTGDFVAACSELAAGMENRQNGLQSALACTRVNIGGNPAAVVGDTASTIRLQTDHDVGAMPSKGLIDRVVHHLIHKVMQTPRSGAADVHPRALAHRFKTFQNLDLLSAVGVLDLRGRGTGGFAHAEIRRTALHRSLDSGEHIR